MPTIHINHSPYDDATLTKLTIFEQYTMAWLPTFIHSYSDSPIYIVDFFAGTGSDSEGTPGSALRIFDVIEKFRKDIINKKKYIRVVLNEFDPEKYTHLSERTMERMSTLSDLTPYVNCSCHNEDFRFLFDRMKESLKRECCFLFMDQNGVKQIGEEIILELEEFDRTDFMFFISSSYFKRFYKESSFKDFDIDITNTRIRDIHRKILHKYRSMLPSNSMTRLFPFSLKKEKSGNIYGLIFGAKHILAAEKFMNVVWTTNPINGEANFDIDNDCDKQMLFDFEEKKITKIDKFFQDLESFVKGKKTFTNKDVLIYSLENGFPVSIAKEGLIKMRKRKVIDHFSHAKIGHDQVFKKKEIVTFKVLK